MELDAGKTTTINMERTVPIGLCRGNDLIFEYDHAVSGVDTDDCAAIFKEDKPEHPITLRVEPTPGCLSLIHISEPTRPY